MIRTMIAAALANPQRELMITSRYIQIEIVVDASPGPPPVSRNGASKTLKTSIERMISAITMIGHIIGSIR
jgi:hypothetical protein